MLLSSSELRETGGWMLGAAYALIEAHDVDLSVASTSLLVKDLVVLKGERITYYIIPEGKGRDRYNKEYETYWKRISAEIHPDVVHIHGTEYTHGLAYVAACGASKVVVSIQGLKSVYSRYYLAGLENDYSGRFLTFHDMITGGLRHEMNLFHEAGEYEKELLVKVNYVIGRTGWDKSHVKAINPFVNYEFCNETLRHEFYSGRRWSYDHCKKHSIFVSQASYPIKGFHQLLKALPIVLRYYPDVTVRVSGKNIMSVKGISGLLHTGGYSRIVKRLIDKNGLRDRISFIGGVTAAQMVEEYLNTNVFVCPSSIENSPNSIGEAQILGVPCVASYVGGVPDMMKGDESHLYRFEEVEMLAFQICRVFGQMDNQSEMIATASKRHDPMTNADRLYEIYCKV